jgi:hypothetical protein
VSTPLANIEERLAKLEAAAERAEQATRDANAATKAMRQTEKDVRHLLATEARKVVDEAIDAAVKEGLAGYADTVRKASHDLYAKVATECERLMNVYMTGDERGKGEHIADLVRGKRRR